MSVVDPPSVAFPILNVKLAFVDNKLLCSVSFTRYNPTVEFHVRPSAFSNASHAAKGSQMWGMVESIKVKMPLGRSSTGSPCIEVDIDWSPTVRSREISDAKAKLIFVGPAFEES